MRSELYSFTEHGTYTIDKGKQVAWAPNRHKIGDLLEALGAICLLADDVDQPAWLDHRAAGSIVAMQNGLLDIASRRAHSPFAALLQHDVGAVRLRPRRTGAETMA